MLLTVIGLSGCTDIPGDQSSAGTPVNDQSISRTIDALVSGHGMEEQSRIERGVKQVASLWRTEDGTIGDFEQFCKENFISGPGELDMVFQKISRNMEILNGHFNKIMVELKSNVSYMKP